MCTGVTWASLGIHDRSRQWGEVGEYAQISKRIVIQWHGKFFSRRNRHTINSVKRRVSLDAKAPSQEDRLSYSHPHNLYRSDHCYFRIQ
jgi:hypothetical protein